MNSSPPASVPTLLAAVRQGDTRAVGQLFSVVYDQLRELAHLQRRRWQQSDTLNTTSLLHEAYLKLARADRIDLKDRAHFMAVAAVAMRRILISNARRQTAQKRGGARTRLSLEDIEHTLESGAGLGESSAEALVALDEALVALGHHSDRQRRVVECRFFGGMSIEDTATALDISPATVKRDWSFAQAWLYRELHQALR